MRIRVAVLMGGPSSEHEVSLKTGKMILKNLDCKKFEAIPVKIEKDGTWPMTIEDLKAKTDVAFIAMHGEYGEDGRVQIILETFRIPYTGSDPITSALAMNKQKTATLLEKSGLLIPQSVTFSKDDPYIIWAIEKIFFNKNSKDKNSSVVIKPADRGSSVGISIIKNKNELRQALEKAFQYSDLIMAQSYIQGKEITCGVLEINQIPIPLLPTEIIPNKADFFDYNAKYAANGSTELTPPNLPPKIIKNIQLIALKVHKLLGCSGMSRTDMILSDNGNVYILEINTIPGMTEASLLPQAAKKIGIEFPQLLEIIIKGALSKNGSY